MEMENHLHQHLLSKSHCCSLFMKKQIDYWQNNKWPLKSAKYHASVIEWEADRRGESGVIRIFSLELSDLQLFFPSPLTCSL